MAIYYGLTESDQIHQLALAVCDVLGHGSKRGALPLLKGTAAQETLYGTYRDRGGYTAGVGLCQCDSIAFYDVQARTRPHVRKAVLDQFGVNIDEVAHRELAYSPLLSFIWCRLHYKLVPEVTPTDEPGRAKYWKKYYNTSAGKGTPEEFIENFNRYVG